MDINAYAIRKIARSLEVPEHVVKKIIWRKFYFIKETIARGDLENIYLENLCKIAVYDEKKARIRKAMEEGKIYKGVNGKICFVRKKRKKKDDV